VSGLSRTGSPGKVTMALRPFRWLAVSALLICGLLGWASAQEPAEKNFTVSAHKYAFSPLVLEVTQDDLVRVTFTTSDIPHSFTIDKYRIAKRAEPGKSVVFEFRADQPGRFPIYCNLAIDERCKEMRGQLVVKPHN
jgi:heme/copper-type cytochrome/quinol oxidase subunit 2